MSKYQTTGYRLGDLSAIAHFQELLWQGGIVGNMAYLDWKYRQNPYLDNRYIVLAWAGGELVGMLGAFGSCWEATGGDRLMLPCLADTLIAPVHRGSSLFRLMLGELIERARVDGIACLLDFGDQPAGPAMVMQGWKPIGPWDVAIGRREGPGATSRLSVNRHHPALDVDSHRAIRGPRTGIAIRSTHTAYQSLLTAMAALVSPNHAVIRHDRDPQYFAWRHRNPLARHFYLAAWSRELEGYLVAHRSRRDADAKGWPTPTTIIDCEATSDNVWMDLLEAALWLLPGSPVLMWARDLSRARLGALGAIGFGLDKPTGRLTQDAHLPNLLVRLTRPVAELFLFADLEAPSSWDLRGVCGRSWR